MKQIVWLAAALWLGASVATLTGYPAVWVDEVLSGDPGIHLARGAGFVSAAWFNQPSWEFWASYPPLHALALAGWLKLFGVSAFAVRAFGLMLITASLYLAYAFLKRLTGRAEWPMVAALALGEPLAFLARAGRPDAVSVFLLCATAWVFVAREWRWRAAALFLLGLLAIPAALQYAAYVLLLGLLVQLWFRPFTRHEIALWLAGAVSGAAVLAAVYAAHGVLHVFLALTVASKHSSAGRLLQQMLLKQGPAPFVFSDIATAPLRDFATPVLLAGAALVWLAAANDARTRKLASLAVACALLIPLAIQLLGKYPIYYTYMSALPASVALLAACRRRWVNAVILSALFLGGAGQLWWRAWRQGAEPVAASSLRQILASDTVVADYPAYYPLVGRTRELFAIGYAGGKVMPHFPPAQGARVTKLLVRDSLFAEVAAKVGGEWQRVGDVLIERQGVPSRWVTIDDDTRHGYRESMGIYVRAVKNGVH